MEKERRKLSAGWTFPPQARKAHYFDEGDMIALCGRWMFWGVREPDTGKASRSDCTVCRRQLEKRAKP